MEANQNLRDRFTSAVSTALEDADAANKNLLTSIDSQYLFFHVSRDFNCTFYELSTN